MKLQTYFLASSLIIYSTQTIAFQELPRTEFRYQESEQPKPKPETPINPNTIFRERRLEELMIKNY